MLVSAIAFSIALATITLAHVFERFGYAPCPLCLQERYAYYFGGAGDGRGVFRRARRVLHAHAHPARAGRAGFLINAGVGVYHSGIEWKWWEGPASCSGGVAVEWGEGGVASAIERATVVSCSEASWRMLAYPSRDGTRWSRRCLPASRHMARACGVNPKAHVKPGNDVKGCREARQAYGSSSVSQ